MKIRLMCCFILINGKIGKLLHVKISQNTSNICVDSLVVISMWINENNQLISYIAISFVYEELALEEGFTGTKEINLGRQRKEVLVDEWK